MDTGHVTMAGSSPFHQAAGPADCRLPRQDAPGERAATRGRLISSEVNTRRTAAFLRVRRAAWSLRFTLTEFDWLEGLVHGVDRTATTAKQRGDQQRYLEDAGPDGID
jgi:hypothetical protein